MKYVSLTENPSHEAQRKLGGENRQEPRRSVQCRGDVMLLQMVVQISVVVV